MRVRALRKRIAAVCLGIAVSAAQLAVRQPGAIAVQAETTVKNQAMLVYLEDSQDLGQAMSGDAKALTAILANTNEFDESNIQSYELPLDSDIDKKTELWKRIHEMAEKTDENSFTVFTYSGHGNAVLDGTSYLAPGGVNNITAAELRSHLDELKGRVLVIISCCFSGGMIMPATELDEMQESPEAFSGEDFVEEFLSQDAAETASANENEQEAAADAASGSENDQAADGGTDSDGETQTSDEMSTKTTNPPQYYFITAANQWETSYSNTLIGTELIASFGHAMGYDRNNSDYHTFGADVSCLDNTQQWDGYEGDGRITMDELAAYYKAECGLTSTPTIYPEESTDVLFTYGVDAGHPATFLAYLKQENVSVNADGTIEITPILQNLTTHDIKLEAGVYDLSLRTFVYNTASSGKYPDGDEFTDGYTAESGGDKEHIVRAGECVSNITFTFTADQFRDCTTDVSKNPFCLKIWECTDAGEKIGSYRALSFFTVPENSKTDAIDASAFALKKPAQLKSKDAEPSYTVTKTSSRLPMDIIYDRESGDTYSSAPCLLALYCYDVGDDMETAFPDGIQACKDEDNYSDVLMDGSRNVISLDKYDKKEVFSNVRPTKERVVEGDYTRRGGIHTYVMDTSGLTEGHFYVLEAVCRDDATEKDKSVYALIQRTSAEDAEEYQIPFFELTSDIFQTFRSNEGIPIGENWTENYSEDQLNVQGVGKRLQKTIQDAAGVNYDIKVTNWKRQSGEQWESMQDTERFLPGQQYLCTIEVSVKDGVNATFTDATQYSLNWHAFESVYLSEDKKTASITIKHKIPSEEFLNAMKLEMFRTDGETVGEKVETSDTTLHPGDKVILVYEDNLTYCNHTGMKYTGKNVTYNGFSYKVYEISDLEKGAEKADLLFDVWKSGEGGCGCGQVLYKWTIYPKSEDGKDDSSDGGTDGGDSSDKGSSGDATGKDTTEGDKTGDGSSGENSHAGSGASGTGTNDGTEKSGAVEEKPAATAGIAANASVITNADMIAAADSQVQDNAVTLAEAANSSGKTQGVHAAVWAHSSAGRDTKDPAENEETGDSVWESETADDASMQESAAESDSDLNLVREDSSDAEMQGGDDTEVSLGLRLYLVWIWILAVLLGIAIYRYLKRRRS